jgi:dethiobiotin synthetase
MTAFVCAPGLAVAEQVAQNAAMLTPDANGYFITGSDTDVGKTYICCQIIAQLRRLNIDLETRKPVESGCHEDDNGVLRTHDAAALQQANDNRETLERINPLRYRAALAPHRAARLQGQRIELAALIDACSRDDPASRLIVEGAGGFYSPLAENGLNADLASALQLPVIIVVADRIGAVGQALMTLQAVTSRHLRAAAIVLNQVAPQDDSAMDNAADLAPHCATPVFCCAYKAALPPMFEAR